MVAMGVMAAMATITITIATTTGMVAMGEGAVSGERQAERHAAQHTAQNTNSTTHSQVVAYRQLSCTYIVQYVNIACAPAVGW
jgi:hypothetical protein